MGWGLVVCFPLYMRTVVVCGSLRDYRLVPAGAGAGSVTVKDIRDAPCAHIPALCREYTEDN